MYTEKNKKLNELMGIAQEIQDFLEFKVSDEPNILVDRLSEINSYIAISGKLLADAKYILDEKMEKAFVVYDEKITSMSPSVATKFITSLCKDENYLVNWSERLNRSLVHIGDNTRTQVSWAKEEMSLTRKGY